jgi:hypothetical protein
MTEAEWMRCSRPKVMLRWLKHRVSDRKLRLLGCACCRHCWQLITDSRLRDAVETSERFADGLATVDKLREVRSLGRVALHDAEAAYRSTRIGSDESSRAKLTVQIAGAALRTGVAESLPLIAAVKGIHQKPLAGLMRDIFGPTPFRPVTVDPCWLTWNGGTVPNLAQVIYDERRFQDLPVLADALEEAGCDNADILAHCRQPGEHVRGCWVVDLLLGRE